MSAFILEFIPTIQGRFFWVKYHTLPLGCPLCQIGRLRLGNQMILYDKFLLETGGSHHYLTGRVWRLEKFPP